MAGRSRPFAKHFERGGCFTRKLLTTKGDPGILRPCPKGVVARGYKALTLAPAPGPPKKTDRGLS